MRIIYSITLACSFLLGGTAAWADIFYNDQLSTIYPFYQFNFDVGNSSPLDYLTYSAMQTGGTAWDGDPSPIDSWNEGSAVPVNQAMTVYLNGWNSYFGPSLCIALANGVFDSEEDHIPLGYGADCYEYH